MLRRAWKPVAGATVLIGTPTYLYYAYSKTSSRQTFDIPVRMRGSDGKPFVRTQPVPLLTSQEVDARLNANATSTVRRRPSGIVWKWSTAFVPSNDPIEDANAAVLVQRDELAPQHQSAEDVLFFAVMDGHGGYDTSRLLSRILIPAVALEFRSLIEEPPVYRKTGLTDRLQLWLGTSKPAGFDADPTYVSLAIQTAFSNVDSDIINAPIRLLAENISTEAKESRTVPDLSQHPMALATMLPAMSGSCALMAVLDTKHENLYVACTGDARAVAGYWDETTTEGSGSWRVEVLSEDQTGRNPKELARVQSEHPSDEAQYVIQRGRVLGGLEPTRAFGDARYKWPKEMQEILSKAFLEGNNRSMRPASSLLKTPPYVTARPVITHRKLEVPLSLDKPQHTSTLRFLILATDGLWDKLSSEEAVALVAGHLKGLKGAIPKTSLPDLVRTASGTPTVEGKDKRKDPSNEGSWAFVDDNLSAHLIRNAFGGGDEDSLRKLMSIPAPYSRSWRDDVTVTVVSWERDSEIPPPSLIPKL
ncbi:protein serine/threonine phosphatase 2C [Punctularia strigosozonata HHB-11173 SS5]|uniref:protein serine/threonine phosphatase 2C n=1 Tax=Punctularia strigosozonata (strain HHB-11173) TaxID=741275 RepID=UPI0004417A1E|nr:protein serine/threonine phosphatase 2C [Punctularia strigosozonata HHB-11173 SS5]EIN10523.1 protein serine/threonine phosphatase 2C [Punctularia strigosozonata HHB-11173 SS5]